MKDDDKKAAVSQDIVVFSIVKAAVCCECQVELFPGNFLRLQRGNPYCLDCADMGHLLFLPSGNVALTRRSRKYSSLSAVVVRFSRARGRYERQGLLVEIGALERAEGECLGDEEAPRAARERAAERRANLDREYLEEFADRIRAQFPNCPTDEATAITTHACEKYSGRIGRSSSAKSFDDGAVELAVRAHVRHRHTTYDVLLSRGLERDIARLQIADATNAILERWRRGAASAGAPPPNPALQSDDHLGRSAPSVARR